LNSHELQLVVKLVPSPLGFSPWWR